MLRLRKTNIFDNSDQFVLDGQMTRIIKLDNVTLSALSDYRHCQIIYCQISYLVTVRARLATFRVRLTTVRLATVRLDTVTLATARLATARTNNGRLTDRLKCM